MNGRGFFQYSFVLIPRRFPITTVVGAPISRKMIETPDEIQKKHKKKVFEESEHRIDKSLIPTHFEISIKSELKLVA